MSLGKRVFTAFFFFIIMPLVVLGTISYLAFQHITEQKYSDQMELSMNAIGRNLNNMIKEANYFSDFWVTTEDSVESVEQALGAGAQSTGGKQDQSKDTESGDYEELLEKQKLTGRVLLTYPGIKSVTLYHIDGKVVNLRFVVDEPIPRDVLERNPIYPEVLKKKRRAGVDRSERGCESDGRQQPVHADSRPARHRYAPAERRARHALRNERIGADV
ncbi:hypothetical protein [Cohnella rhizosphaerae]|uniref:Uncharacterized protein n=1 Tax=Cohnella rhizosphaerae TaxID=1457232 RepID=A0A9X4L1W7_9BACL|nr:hypothetical protein [Cohnella rhizosphaerae]MDG0812017.1 hypothetical protein [Cohnella rhizosphaerae]